MVQAAQHAWGWDPSNIVPLSCFSPSVVNDTFIDASGWNPLLSDRPLFSAFYGV